jgi:hypothetical protein
MECRKSIRRSLRPWTRPFLGSLHWVTGGLPKPPRLETPGMMQSNCELHGSVVVFQVCPGRKAFPDVILNAAESELNVLSTCVCLNIYSVLFYSLNLTFFIIVRSILQFQTHPDIISNCHKLIVYPIDIHWLYSFISHITIVAVYPPFSKRFFQLHPTSSIVAPNGPAVIAEGPLRAGALIFSLYDYISHKSYFWLYIPYISQILSDYMIAPIIIPISPIISSVSPIIPILVANTLRFWCRSGHSHRGHVSPRSAGRQREGGALVLTI